MSAHGASSSLEIERKYEVLGDGPIPPIELPGVAAVVEVRDQMVASYWDTDARDLGRAGLALRSRAGGEDEGWHLKERGPDGVRELHWPTEDELPQGALNAVRERLRGQVVDVHPVATVQTDRTVRRLHDAYGSLLVELADDHVFTIDHEAGVARAWREWEAELGEGADPSLLDLVEPQLIAAGARPSLSEAKIQRTLGQSVPAAWRRRATLPELVACALTDLADRVAALSDAVRADEPDAVHRTRVLLRRARDIAAVFRDELGVSREDLLLATEAIQGLGALLGAVRDAEVRAEGAERLLAEQAAAPGLRRVRRLLVGAAQKERAAALAELRERIETEPSDPQEEGAIHEMYPLGTVANRLRALAYLAARQDPARDGAGGPSASPEPAMATRIDDCLALIDGVALERTEGTDEDAFFEHLHRVRKHVRRIRNVAEGLGESSGAPKPVPASLSALLAHDAHALQDVLGAARDLNALAVHLDELADAAHDDRDDAHAATYHLAVRLAAQVRDEAGATLEAAPSALARLQKHRLGA